MSMRVRWIHGKNFGTAPPSTNTFVAAAAGEEEAASTVKSKVGSSASTCYNYICVASAAAAAAAAEAQTWCNPLFSMPLRLLRRRNGIILLALSWKELAEQR